MSSQVITRTLGGNAPQSYALGASETLEPTAIFAQFDGSAAASAFRPCVSYYTQDGKLFARAFPTDTVAAGGSANVAYFPGLSQSSRPSGLFFDVRNSGDWLDITLTGSDSFGNGMTIAGTPVEIDSDVLFNGSNVSAVLDNNFEVTVVEWIILNGDFVEIVPAATPSWQTTTHASGKLRLGDQHSDVQIGDDRSGAGGATCEVNVTTLNLGNPNNTTTFVNGTTLRVLTTNLGFYGAAAVARQTVTGSRGGNAALASLLTALATLGLFIDNST